MNKSFIRNQELQKRLAITEDQLNGLSAQIAEKILGNFTFTKNDVIHVFLPILSKNEINTFLLIEKLHVLGVKTVVPVSDFKTKEMVSFELAPTTELRENKYQIPEPVNANRCDDDRITHVITPLLAFDQKGHRIGYGGGFYDRFFEKTGANAVKIGVSLSEAYLPFEFAEMHDVCLDYCVTPNNIYQL